MARNYWFSNPKDLEISRLRAELEATKRARSEFKRKLEESRAELELLKPKPVIRYMCIERPSDECGDGLYMGPTQDFNDNLRLIFTNGVLTDVEVINQGDSK